MSGFWGDGAPPGHPGYVSGLRYPGISTNAVNTNISANQLGLTPIWIGAPVVIDRLIITVQTGSAGTAKVGLYRCNADGSFSLVGENTADMSTAAAADLSGSFAAPLPLTPGWYAGACCLSALTTMRTSSGAVSNIAQIFGSTTDGGATASGGTFAAGAFMSLTYAAGPTPFFPATILPGSLTRASGAIAANVSFRVA